MEKINYNEMTSATTTVIDGDKTVFKQEPPAYLNRPSDLPDRIVMRSSTGRIFMFKRQYKDRHQKYKMDVTSDYIIYSIIYDGLNIGMIDMISNDYKTHFTFYTINDSGIILESVYEKAVNESYFDFCYRILEDITENYHFGEDQKRILEVYKMYEGDYKKKITKDEDELKKIAKYSQASSYIGMGIMTIGLVILTVFVILYYH